MEIYNNPELHHDWLHMIEYQDKKIQLNLIKTALARTNVQEFTEENYQ